MSTSNTSPLPDPYLTRLHQLVAEQGEANAVKRLGIGHATLARGLARLPLRPGTRLMICTAIDRTTP